MKNGKSNFGFSFHRNIELFWGFKGSWGILKDFEESSVGFQGQKTFQNPLESHKTPQKALKLLKNHSQPLKTPQDS